MEASEAAAMPLPSEDTTPPVTKIRGVMARGLPESHSLPVGGPDRTVDLRSAPCSSRPDQQARNADAPMNRGVRVSAGEYFRLSARGDPTFDQPLPGRPPCARPGVRAR